MDTVIDNKDSMPSDSTNVYCLFCKTGREQSVAGELEKRGISCLIAYASRIAVRNGIETREKRTLLPGYVFAETDASWSFDMNFIHRNQDSLKLLGYEYNEYALRGDDLEFYKWLKGLGGIIDISRVYQVGDRIKVTDGPLKAYEGRIVAVNRKRKCVAFSLGDESLMSRIWCSVEYLERESE